MENIVSNAKNLFFQWDRLRHPLAGWTRIALFLLLPLIFWSHDVLLILLWPIALFSHPWWFQPYIELSEDMPFPTRVTDALHDWFETASPLDKARQFIPAVGLLIPLLSFLWAHNTFWAFYFFAFVITYMALFILHLFSRKA